MFFSQILQYFVCDKIYDSGQGKKLTWTWIFVVFIFCNNTILLLDITIKYYLRMHLEDGILLNNDLFSNVIIVIIKCRKCSFSSQNHAKLLIKQRSRFFVICKVLYDLLRTKTHESIIRIKSIYVLIVNWIHNLTRTILLLTIGQSVMFENIWCDSKQQIWCLWKHFLCLQLLQKC